MSLTERNNFSTQVHFISNDSNDEGWSGQPKYCSCCISFAVVLWFHVVFYFVSEFFAAVTVLIAWKQRRRRRQRERQKSNRFRLAKQQLCTCITLFCTLLCRHYMTATWKCFISRFVEDVNTRQRLLFLFLELWYCVLEFNSRKICCCLSSLCTHYLTTPSRQLSEISKINLLSICAFFYLFHFCRVFHSLGRQVASWFLQVALCSYEKRFWHRLRILGRSWGSFWSLTWRCCRLSR